MGYEGRFVGSDEWLRSSGTTPEGAALHLARLHGGERGLGRVNRKERIRALSGQCYAVRLAGCTGEVILDVRPKA